MARSRIKRLALAAASSTFAVGGALAAATPAHASPGGRTCGSDPDTGIVCITEDNGGYNVEFWSAMPGGTARFKLYTSDGNYWDNGAFSVWTDSYNSFYFSGRHGSAAVCAVPSDWRDYNQVCTSYLVG